MTYWKVRFDVVTQHHGEEPTKHKRAILVESADMDEAEARARPCATSFVFGPRVLSVEMRSVSSVTLPLDVSDAHGVRENQTMDGVPERSKGDAEQKGRVAPAANTRSFVGSNPTAVHPDHSDSALLRIIDTYGIQYSTAELSDPSLPYTIHVSLAGHGETTCCGATPREAAQRARDWIARKNADGVASGSTTSAQTSNEDTK